VRRHWPQAIPRFGRGSSSAIDSALFSFSFSINVRPFAARIARASRAQVDIRELFPPWQRYEDASQSLEHKRRGRHRDGTVTVRLCREGKRISTAAVARE